MSRQTGRKQARRKARQARARGPARPLGVPCCSHGHMPTVLLTGRALAADCPECAMAEIGDALAGGLLAVEMCHGWPHYVLTGAGRAALAAWRESTALLS